MKMESRSALKRAIAMCVGLIAFGTGGRSFGQLQVTEIMYDTLASGESVMEWVEIRNLGGSPVDLNGAFLDSLGDTVPPPGAAANIRNDLLPAGANTIVPANGVAIIYDAFLSTNSPFNHDESYFRTSWSVPAAAAIIPADFWPGLNNSGTDSLGIWASRTEYDMDAVPDTTPPISFDVVGSFNNALTSITYQTSSPWPGTAAGRSIQWSGNGSNGDGAQWYESESGQNGAVTNAPINLPGANRNSDQDLANPSFVPGGTQPAGLLVTEILYNPRSPENLPPGENWEWLEIRNNTGSTIDFASTPYVLDDLTGNNIAAENITIGLIPDDSVAVLFNSNMISVGDMQAAWGNFVNFIPVNVTDFSLNGGGDTIGLWSTLAAYEAETDLNPEGGVTRTFDNAVLSQAYGNNVDGWPDDDGNASIYLTNLANDPALGTNWTLATLTDGLSYTANQVTGSLVVHPGGDVASPGTFTVLPPESDADYNEDGTIDAADYVLWRKSPADFGGNPGGYEAWREQFGETVGGGSGGAVPEPASMMMLAIGLAALCFRRRSA
jgi:hypothetical protein